MVSKKLEQGNGKDNEQVKKNLFVSSIVWGSIWTVGHCAHAEKILLRTFIENWQQSKSQLLSVNLEEQFLIQSQKVVYPIVMDLYKYDIHSIMLTDKSYFDSASL